jgi:hypothetical protein
MKASKLNLMFGAAFVSCLFGAFTTAPAARAALFVIASALTVGAGHIYARERKPVVIPARTRRGKPIVVRRRPRNW